VSGATFEFPGFRIPDAPTFTGALGTSMFYGQLPTPTPVLDLAMVFGSRLWGHDLPLDGDALGAAPGVGDLYAHELRDKACAALCVRVAQELEDDVTGWRSLVLHTGSEAVETAIKTAILATGRHGLVAFEGGYHGTFGLALAVTHGEQFREAFWREVPTTTTWAPWGVVPAMTGEVAAVVVEPWQGRAGVIPPPSWFFSLLREECDRVGALLILDAVLCGAGRTGPTIAECIRDANPDIVCLGKAIGSGVTASAVVAREHLVTRAWDKGPVEPAHTSTSIGDPLACAGIVHSIGALQARGDELTAAGDAWRDVLTPIAETAGVELRGIGLLWALDTGKPGGGVELAKRLLAEHRILVVPSGLDGASITLYPAATTSDLELERVAEALRAVLG
jgi:4-aminobutyrate aminotransferase/(S)-3-amino-2-methylpropionate transaminase